MLVCFCVVTEVQTNIKRFKKVHKSILRDVVEGLVRLCLSDYSEAMIA